MAETQSENTKPECGKDETKTLAGGAGGVKNESQANSSAYGKAKTERGRNTRG
jgi:hypothetical protein